MSARGLFAACLAASAIGCSSETVAAGGDGFPEDVLTTVTSAAGMLVIDVRTSPAQPPERGRSSMELTVRAHGEALDGLEIEPVTWMPSMGHGASVVPTVEPKGSGRYVIEDLEMYMPGRWEIRADFAGPMVDTATVSFDVL